jgi:uncharacterized protein YndB with AHSA1/START domain
MTTKPPSSPSPTIVDAFVVDRSVLIRADRALVFRYFTDPERFAAWWGPGSTIDARPGGRVDIRYPNGVTAGGEVIEVVPRERVVFTYGYDDPGKPIARGGSRVVVTFADEPDGTRVQLRHHVADAATRDAHVPGWRFQLSLFANVVTGALNADLEPIVDGFFALWSNPDAEARAQALAQLARDDVAFRDRFAALEGRADLLDHIAASQVHMPGVALRRAGAVRSCQGTALVAWTAVAGDRTVARGSNVFTFAADGRVASVVGFSDG